MIELVITQTANNSLNLSHYVSECVVTCSADFRILVIAVFTVDAIVAKVAHWNAGRSRLTRERFLGIRTRVTCPEQQQLSTSTH